MGNVSVGYGKSFKAPESTAITAGATTPEFYENTGMSIGYAVNDDVSVSYSNEVSEKNNENIIYYYIRYRDGLQFKLLTH